MYTQQKFNETRLDVLHALIRSHPLGAFVVVGNEGLEVNHFPFFLDAIALPFGVLRGHIPKGNLIWQDFCQQEYEAVVIFQGEESYITPSWYPTKHQHGKAVPTWNYATVHAYGQPRFIHEHAWLLSHVTELTDQQEAAQALPWQVSDAPADYVASMLDKIVGVDAKGNVGKDIGEQALFAIANLNAVLAEAGMDNGNLAKVTIFLTDAALIPAFMEAAAQTLPSPPPATTLLVVKALAAPPLLVEIEAIAVA